MKVVRLGRAALDAELLRLRSVATRGARRAAFAAVAALFGLFTLAVLHVAAYFVLSLDARITPAWSAVIVAGGDLFFVVVMLIAARTGGPSATEIEARILRDRALSELRTSLAIATFTGPAARYAGRGAFGLARRAFHRRR
jgi:hypothetical protein